LHWSVPPIRLSPRNDEQDLREAFVANLNHELRTPLAAIIGLAQVLGEESDGDALEYVEMIRASGRRLHGSVERMLESVDRATDVAKDEEVRSKAA